jgi:hypothetical protein
MVNQLTEGTPRHHLHESDTALEEDLLDDLGHLKSVGREIQERLDVRETVVSEERVNAKVASVIGHLVNWTDQ